MRESKRQRLSLLSNCSRVDRQHSVSNKPRVNSFKKNKIDYEKSIEEDCNMSHLNINNINIKKKKAGQNLKSLNFSLSVSTAHSNTIRSTETSPFLSSQLQTTYTMTMMERWNQYIKQTTIQTDQIDLQKNKSLQYSYEHNQFCPEYAQQVYNGLVRELLASNQKLQNDQNMSDSSQENIKNIRDQYIHKLISLCYKKNYKPETQHLAVSIFDKIYFSKSFLKIINEQYLTILYVTSVIIAAKMQQPLSPSIKMTLKLLSSDELTKINKNLIIQMEEKILNYCEFDFNIQSPLTYLERYIRLLNLQSNKDLTKQAKQMCLEARTFYCFKKFDQRVLAAGCLFAAFQLSKKDHKHSEIDRWNQEIEAITQLDKKEIIEVINIFQQFITDDLQKNIKYDDSTGSHHQALV